MKTKASYILLFVLWFGGFISSIEDRGLFRAVIWPVVAGGAIAQLSYEVMGIRK